MKGFFERIQVPLIQYAMLALLREDFQISTAKY